MQILNIATILVGLPDGSKRRYVLGQDLADCPVDQLTEMLRLGQAVEVADNPVEEPDEESGEDDSTDQVDVDGDAEDAGDPEEIVSPNWYELGLREVGLDEGTITALNAAGLETIGEVVAVGQKTGSLLSIEGIGAGREKAIQSAIEKVAGS